MPLNDAVIRVVLQRHDWDCGVACLAMLCNTSYETALVACAQTKEELDGEGLYLYEMVKAAELLDVSVITRRAKRFSLDTDTGILHVFNLKTAVYHVVMLWQGRLIETDGTIWEDADTYLSSKGFKPGALITKE